MRRPVQRIAQIVDIGQKRIDHKTASWCEMIVGVLERLELLFNFVEVSNRIEGQEDQIELPLLLKLIVAHVAFVQRHALLDLFRLLSQLATIRSEHLWLNIKSLQLV